MRPPFDLGSVSLFQQPDRLVTFRDRHERPAPAQPVRPARYETGRMWLMRIEPSGSSLELHWPALACARTVDLDPGGPVTTLLELSILPFALRDLLTGLAGGAPTFYLGYEGVPFPPENEAVRPSDSSVALDGAWLGITFQDRLALAPWAWFDRLAAAPGAAPEWAAWAQAFDGRRALRLLDATGAPFAGQPVSVDQGGPTFQGVSDDAGEVPGLPASGALSWQPPMAAEPLPMMSLSDTATANVSGVNRLDLPAGFAGGHLQLLALADWLAPYQHEDPMSPLPGARFRRRSRMEPLVDGDESFARLLADIDQAKGAGGAAYFAGWAFNDFPMRPGDDSTRLVEIARAMKNTGTVKVLAARFLQAPDAALDSLSEEAGLLLLILIEIGYDIAVITNNTGHTDDIGFVAFVLIAAGTIALYVKLLGEGNDVRDALMKSSEQTSPEFLAELAAECHAIYSAHPALIDDNPLAQSIPLPDGRELRDLQDRWGIFHQKIQLVRRSDPPTPAPPQPDPERYSAYLGGIDVNRNRLDSPGHNGAAWAEPDSSAEPREGPFHDVHCRLTGAAASEVFHVFRGRDEISLSPAEIEERDQNPPADRVAVPRPDEWGEPGHHVIQVAQTSYRPRPGHTGFPWAPQGNRTTHDTFVAAIKAAREHIYIEEQYMVPSDQYMAALVAAAEHCQRLAILLPTYLEVYFGDRKRGAFFDDLADAWGDRLYIGTPLRRPVLAAPGRTTSRGRLSLLKTVDAATGTIIVGPSGRVPSGRFFLWIEGELMYAVASNDVMGPDGQPAKELQVLRGGNGTGRRWCEHPRAHDKGAAVTASQPRGIFLHSKIMMVDDLFVAIGSTNINRRGFFHDGEITAFAIPEALRTAPDNPARDLRARLWGEQLGLTPELGLALLRDPIAGFELFKRSRYEGNRVVPLNELAVPVPTLDDLPDLIENLPAWVTNFIRFALQLTLEPLGQRILDTVSDPTTSIGEDP